MWVARDKYRGLHIFANKPEFKISTLGWIVPKDELSRLEITDESLFPDLTWEDEPIEVELTEKTKPYIIGENLVDYLSCPEYYPQKQPENFYLNKATYTDNYFNIIRNCAMDNYVIIHCDLDKETSQVESVYIDSVATLEKFWNNEFKKIYEQ